MMTRRRRSPLLPDGLTERLQFHLKAPLPLLLLILVFPSCHDAQLNEERNLLAVGPTEVQWTVKDLDILVQVTPSGNWTAAPLNFEFQIGKGSKGIQCDEKQLWTDTSCLENEHQSNRSSFNCLLHVPNSVDVKKAMSLRVRAIWNSETSSSNSSILKQVSTWRCAENKMKMLEQGQLSAPVTTVVSRSSNEISFSTTILNIATVCLHYGNFEYKYDIVDTTELPGVECKKILENIENYTSIKMNKVQSCDSTQDDYPYYLWKAEVLSPLTNYCLFGYYQVDYRLTLKSSLVSSGEVSTVSDFSYALVATVVAIVSIAVLVSVVIYFKKDCAEYVHEKKKLNDESSLGLFNKEILSTDSAKMSLRRNDDFKEQPADTLPERAMTQPTTSKKTPEEKSSNPQLMTDRPTAATKFPGAIHFQTWENAATPPPDEDDSEPTNEVVFISQSNGYVPKPAFNAYASKDDFTVHLI